MVAESIELLTCPACGKEGLKGSRGQEAHDRLLHPKPMQSSEQGDAVIEAVAEKQPAVNLEGVSWRATDVPHAALPTSVRDPDSRIVNHTHAWYFAPPVPSIEGMSTTCLPSDVFLSSPSWQPHQVTMQTDYGHVLVTPVELHGAKLRGSPYVHVLPPEELVWNEIVELWSAALPMEIAIEQDLLDQSETDLLRATDSRERADARQTIRVLSTRVLQLQSLNFRAIRQFFVREHELSRMAARNDNQRTEDIVDSRIDAYFEDHSG